MRATEFMTETMSVPAGDPILNDPNLYLLLEHYLGKAFIKWAASESPYTPRNSFTQKIAVTAIKPYYNRVAAQLKPLAAGPEPDIDQILNIVFSIPGFVNQGSQDFILAKIKNQKAADEISGWVWKGTSTQTAKAGTTNEDWNKVNRRDKTNGLHATWSGA